MSGEFCRHCGRSEAAHHSFDAEYEKPDGCECRAYDDITTPICDDFVIFKGDAKGICSRCKHRDDCHRNKRAGRP